MLEHKIIEALKKSCEMHGGQVNLAKSSTVSQGQISDYLCGRRKIQNMTIGTLEKLFPEISISFFKDAEKDNVIPQILEKQMLEFFRTLTPEKQIKCFGLMCQTFSNKPQE